MLGMQVAICVVMVLLYLKFKVSGLRNAYSFGAADDTILLPQGWRDAMLPAMIIRTYTPFSILRG